MFEACHGMIILAARALRNAMTRIYLALVISALLAAPCGAAVKVERGALTYDNIPTIAPELVDQLAMYLNARQATPLGWSPNGHLLITTRFGDVPQLHVVENAAGTRRQLTFQREPITAASYSPDPGRDAYVYLKDAGGNENAQLYYQRSGEAAKLLTDGKSRNGSPVWSNGGREVAFFSTARDPASFDIDIVEPDTGALPRLVVTADGPGAQWAPLDWSPDDRKLLVLKTVASDEAYLYVLDLGTGQKKEVDAYPGKVAIAGAKFSRDGQGVYYISDRDSEFSRLRYANLFTGERTVISVSLPWDVEELAISRDGHYLAYVGNEGGAAKLNLLDLRTHQDLAPPRLPIAGSIESLHFDAQGQRLAFGYAASNQPGDAFVLDVAHNQLEPWTRSEAGDVDLKKFVTPRLAQFPTFDRLDGKPRLMPVYVYEPAGGGSHPVLLELHGGPEAQFRPGFFPWIEFVVNELGYAVVAPNVRGSSGYGKSYMALDNGILREDAVKDVGALLVWLGLQSNFDAKHIVVSGGSYGGYMALAAMVNYGDRLRGGVDVAGIADFVTFLGGTAPYRQNQRRAEYGDERDADMRAFLRRISPLTNADRITKPLLVVHGKNDPRVPVGEAEQMVNRIRLKGGEVWYLLAADEGHGYAKKQNRDAYYAVFAQFLTQMRQ
jgi:dipeptidyl aminopeptidase/acylaminoacyl peptidase